VNVLGLSSEFSILNAPAPGARRKTHHVSKASSNKSRRRVAGFVRPG